MASRSKSANRSVCNGSPGRVMAPQTSQGSFEDHWVCEYWNGAEERWVLVDAQLDELQQAKHLHIVERRKVAHQVASDKPEPSHVENAECRGIGITGAASRPGVARDHEA